MTTLNIQTIKMTADQYFELGEDPPGVRLELIDGEIIVSPSANPGHSRVIVKLTQLLMNYIEANELGELFLDTDVPFEKFTVRRPDIAFYAVTNRNRISSKRLLGPPDLCIEVLSPGNVADDRENKFSLYQKHRVKHYWIIDPDKRIAECFALSKGAFKKVSSARGDQTVHFPPFVDLVLPLSTLWMPAS